MGRTISFDDIEEHASLSIVALFYTVASCSEPAKELTDPEKNLVPRLGILAVTIGSSLARALPELRIPSGVIVVANTTLAGNINASLKPRDIIHSVNNQPVTTLEQLRSLLTARAVRLCSRSNATVHWISPASKAIDSNSRHVPSSGSYRTGKVLAVYGSTYSGCKNLRPAGGILWVKIRSDSSIDAGRKFTNKNQSPKKKSKFI